MSDKFKNKYKINSTRLKNYNYSQHGIYFITICVKNRKNYFGEIANGKMTLSEIGKIADQFWQEIPKHFPSVKLDKYQIMPDHLHGIIEILYKQINGSETHHCYVSKSNTFHQLKSGSLPVIIRSFKSVVAKTARKQFPKVEFNWQPRFYDRIIRNEIELNKIREYIQINPKMWGQDIDDTGNIFIP